MALRKVWCYTSPAEIDVYLLKMNKDHLRYMVGVWWGHARGDGVVEPPILFAFALWGEARGEPVDGRHAVAEVICNRAARSSSGCIDEVLLEPYQFSCFDLGDQSLQGADVVQHQTVVSCVAEAQRYLVEYNNGGPSIVSPDTTIYCTVAAGVRQFQRYLNGEKICWNFDHVVLDKRIGRHVFFREV